MYVIAHEWGHHIQNISGIMNGLDLQDTGPNSDAVRLEVQADCFAGAWVGAAQNILDEDGTPFLQPVTQQQINDALSAAAAVGDDRIQETTQGQVNPERWTHGSSEMRVRWFNAGLEGGPNACNTFEVGNL
jgi:predicted metalloprotease